MNNKITKTLFGLFFFCLMHVANAQAPNKFSFQAVIKNASQVPVVSSPVGLQISILPSATGASVYSERHIVTTNSNGLASVIIGDGTSQTGSFTTINWASGTYFIKTEIDPVGGTNYTISNTVQLLSVPYALQANEKDPQVSTITNNIVPKWNNATSTLVDGQIIDNGTSVGIGTSTPANKLEVAGKIKAETIQLTTNPVAGHFLRSDASGNTIWAPELDPKIQVNLINSVPRFSSTNVLENGIITDNGTNIGISNSNPTEKLDVLGKVKASQFIMTNGATNGYVLQSDALGNASWNNLASIETDPQVSVIANNAVPRWNGGTLVDGQLFDSSTNVGIGTNAPLHKLHLYGGDLYIDKGGLTDVSRKITIEGKRGAAGSAFAQIDFNNYDNAANYTAASIRSENPAGNNSGDLRFFTAESYTPTTKMIISHTGNVGIGTTTPTQARLVVNGFESNSVGNFGQFKSDGTGSTNSTGTPYAYSIYASNRIAASEFNAFSDERIKNIKGISNKEADLKTLLSIEITDYKLKDSVSSGNKNYKKVIAQQVEKVYPQAVSFITDIIPDIYKMAEMKSGFILLKNNLKVGEKVKLIKASGDEILEVVEANQHGFKINSDKTEEVFVFGRQVNDFHTVDYEALTTLNISATQELFNEIQKLRLENEILKSEISVIDEIKQDFEAEKKEMLMLKNDLLQLKNKLESTDKIKLFEVAQKTIN